MSGTLEFLQKQLPKIQQFVILMGGAIVTFDLFDLAWPYKLAIGTVVIFIMFSFNGIWDDEDHNSKI